MSEKLCISSKRFSPEAVAALEEMGYHVQGPDEHGYYSVEIPAEDFGPLTEDEEQDFGTWIYHIGDHTFWQSAPDGRFDPGLILVGSEEAKQIEEEAREEYRIM